VQQQARNPHHPVSNPTVGSLIHLVVEPHVSEECLLNEGIHGDEYY
jgi:hypothetical protein